MDHYGGLWSSGLPHSAVLQLIASGSEKRAAFIFKADYIPSQLEEHAHCHGREDAKPLSQLCHLWLSTAKQN
jgi:hypothetical protein